MLNFRKKIDFLAVGDVTTDAFIRIKDASVHCEYDHNNYRLCMNFGAKIPYESTEIINAVGNSPNTAVAAARLGLSSAVICDIGIDKIGEDTIKNLSKNKVKIKYIKKHKGFKTNYHYVLWYKNDRTILVKHEEFPYKFPKIPEPKWIYLSSLADHSLPYHDEIKKYLELHPSVKLAFQPGTFQIKMGYESMSFFYKRAEVFFCNVEEAQKILKTEKKDDDVKNLLEKIKNLGPKIVSITDGPNGAYTYDGKEMLKIQSYPNPKLPFERTGAGDAYSSTFTCALILGKTVSEALSWGPINSMSVIQQVGSQKGLLNMAELEKYLKKAPKEYTPQKIN